MMLAAPGSNSIWFNAFGGWPASVLRSYADIWSGRPCFVPANIQTIGSFKKSQIQQHVPTSQYQLRLWAKIINKFIPGCFTPRIRFLG